VPLELPTLDDRTYPDLVKEGLELVPRFAPEWTNHNASDPGITLLELFAYLAEIQLYRVNRISDAARDRFLALLGVPPGEDGALATTERLRGAAAEVRRPGRAVTPADFDSLAREVCREGGEGEAVSRVYCLPRRDLDAGAAEGRRRDRPNHVSVVFVPQDLFASRHVIDAIAERIRTAIEPRRLLTTRVHVVAARFVDVTIRIQVSMASAETAMVAERSVREALQTFIDPPPDGWVLGRSVYVAELYRLLSHVPGVSRLDSIELDAAGGGLLLKSDDGDVVGIQLEPDELLRLRRLDVTVHA